MRTRSGMPMAEVASTAAMAPLAVAQGAEDRSVAPSRTCSSNPAGYVTRDWTSRRDPNYEAGEMEGSETEASF